MKKFLSLLLCLSMITALSLPASAASDWPAGIGIESEGGILIDGKSGAILCEKNSHNTYFPASITKILTALIVIENCDLNETVTFSHNAVYNVEQGSSNAGISEGDTLTVRECLYALLLSSANESANALAEHVAESTEDFARMMNEKAEALGCTDSHFNNPSGLNDPDHYTTAYDMALIAKAAFDNETFREINSTTYHKLPPTKQDPEGLKIYAHHKMMSKNSGFYYPGIIGGKTGYTTLAGNTLVTGAERDDMRLITVVLNGTTPSYYNDTKALLDYGFDQFQSVDISDLETGYADGNDDLTIRGLSLFDEPLLSLDAGSITLPKSAAFTDVASSLSFDLSIRDPADAVARVQYTYLDKNVGSAYLRLSSGPVRDLDEEALHGQERGGIAPHSSGSDIPEETNDGATAERSSSSRIPASAWTAAAIILILSAIIGCIIAVKIYLEKKESGALTIRRERRRRRHQDSGISIGDFNVLMNRRRSSFSKRRRPFWPFRRR